MRIRGHDRYELKYLLEREQRERLVKALADHLKPDVLGDDQGRYPVTSLYYDTVDHKAYWDKIEGQRFRRKVRIRVYGDQVVTPSTSCFVEIKQRTNMMLQKRRVVLPYSSAVALCGAGDDVKKDTKLETDRAVISEVQYLHYALQLRPACVVGYSRLAFEDSEYEPDMRVTFDTDLKCRIHDLTLLSQSHAEDHIFLPPGWCVMEIKVNYRVPYWLTELIGHYRCTLRRISKYCTALEQSKALLQRQQIVC